MSGGGAGRGGTVGRMIEKNGWSMENLTRSREGICEDCTHLDSPATIFGVRVSGLFLSSCWESRFKRGGSGRGIMNQSVLMNSSCGRK